MPLAGLIPLLILLAISVSYIGSISGVGGGVIFTPLLLLLLPLEMPQIKIISTILVFIGSFINFFIEIIKRKVNWILFILIVPVSVPSIFLGHFLETLISQKIAKIIIIVILLIVTVLLIVTEYYLNRRINIQRRVRKKWYLIQTKYQTVVNIWWLIVISFGGCLITTLTGMGGGPIIMPLLMLICSLKLKEAAPISHMLIAISTLFTIIIGYQAINSTTLVLNYITPMLIGVIIGTIIAFLTKKYITKEVIIKWILIVLIWGSIIKMVLDII
jgi:uncharacterized membrane protein YfcA